MTDKCTKCGNEYKIINVYRDELVGQYKTCRTIKYLKSGLFREDGCREIEWIIEPEYCEPEEEKDYSDRKVFKPEGATCGKCGGPLGFYQRPSGLWTPCEPSGEDHWDACRENLSIGRYGKKKIFNTQTPAGTTYPKNKKTKFYNGDTPPWE